jgi:hypothetical protein
MRTYHIHWHNTEESSFEVIKAETSNEARKKVHAPDKIINRVVHIK